MIADTGTCRVARSGSLVRVSHVTVTKIVQRLQAEGLVETAPYRPLKLTTKGTRLAAKSRRAMKSSTSSCCARPGRTHGCRRRRGDRNTTSAPARWKNSLSFWPTTRAERDAERDRIKTHSMSCLAHRLHLYRMFCD